MISFGLFQRPAINMNNVFRIAACVIFTAAISACQTNSDKLAPLAPGIQAPIGTSTVSEAVDGLVVGHRLMGAGEFELALKAYTRAAAEQGFTLDVLSAIGSANLKLGRLGQAQTLLEAAVKKDETFVPAWNNLGVVLMNRGEYREAERVFKLAFALDSGNSDEIRANLTKAIAKSQDSDYSTLQEQQEFELVRRGNGRYLLLQTPNSI